MVTTMTTMLRFRSDTETNRIADYERMYKNEHIVWIYQISRISRIVHVAKFSFGSTKKGVSLEDFAVSKKVQLDILTLSYCGFATTKSNREVDKFLLFVVVCTYIGRSSVCMCRSTIHHHPIRQ